MQCGAHCCAPLASIQCEARSAGLGHRARIVLEGDRAVVYDLSSRNGVKVNGAPVRDTSGLRAAMSRVKPGSTALLKVKRGRVTQFAAVPVPAK